MPTSRTDQEIDEFVRAVCLAHPELRSGGLERLVESLEEAMLSITLLGPLQEAAVMQHQLVDKLVAALRGMGQNASTVAWETTGAVLFAPGVLGSIGANVAGNALGGMVRKQIERGEVAVAGPVKLQETLDANYRESLDQARQSVDAWQKALEQATAIFQTPDVLSHEAEAFNKILNRIDLNRIDSDLAVGALEALTSLSQRFMEAKNKLEASLAASVSRCNESAVNTLQGLSAASDHASAAGGVAVAGLLASWLSSSDSKANEEEALRLARRADRRAAPIHNPFWAHGDND
jgi:hypothetical protein